MTRARILQSLSAVAFIGIAVYLVIAGVRLRWWVWEQSAAIHYTPDMQNALNWGTRASHDGYFALYDRVIAGSRPGDYGLDYVPLRLAVMTLWAHWVGAHYPGVTQWRSDYAFNAPLLRLNLAMELIAAIGMFFLVRQWIRKEREPLQPPGVVVRWFSRRFRHRGATDQLSASSPTKPIAFLTGYWPALFAAALVWFSPAAIFGSFGRPTWDVWVIPFYVWAVFFAARNNWLIAGALVGAGAMMKGQQLLAAPIFLLWPLFSLQFGAMLRWLIGLALAAGLIVSPWQVWLATKWGPSLLCISAAMICPTIWLLGWRVQMIRRWFPLRRAAWGSAFLLAVALWLTPLLFTVSTGWMKIGFIYGVDKMPDLESGGPACVAAILQHRYGWSSNDPAATLPFTHVVLSMKSLLVWIGYALIAVTAAAAAWHARKHDRRFLIAVAAPWLVIFTVFPQMHERYLLWGALMTAAAASISLGLTGLHVLVTALAWVMEMDQLLRDGNARLFGKDISPTFGRSLLAFTHGCIPDSGWAVAVICCVWLWAMWLFPRRRSDGRAPFAIDETLPLCAGEHSAQVRPLNATASLGA